MDWLRSRTSRTRYEPVNDDTHDDYDDSISPTRTSNDHAFSQIEYYIFLLLGLATLWPFNMFLNAGPYLQQRFKSSPSIRDTFQATETSVASVGTLVSLLVLTKLQANAVYTRRISISLLIYLITFALLALSTRVLLDVSAQTYFVFFVVTVLVTSLGTGMIQNGSFAYASQFGQQRYMQGMMVGQAVAGVLPSVVQICLALLVNRDGTRIRRRQQGSQIASGAALGYFLTALLIAAGTLIASTHLFARRDKAIRAQDEHHDPVNNLRPSTKTVPLLTLLRKLCWPAAAVTLCFAITMAPYPVYTQEIQSVYRPIERTPSYLQPPVFIPLAFLCWNAGDLAGRIMTAWPALTIRRRPRLLFILSAARALLVPVYTLCNIRGQGAVISSDAFYMAFQLVFGLTNGYVGSLCMMSTVDYVESDEAAAAGSFMGLCLVFGLGIGSLAGFAFTVT